MRLNYHLIFAFAWSFSLSLQAQDTFSIVAMDSETGEVGSAGASCVDLSNFPSIYGDDFLGQLIPGQAAINTQAYYLPANQNNARNQILNGSSPQETIDWLIANDVQNAPQFRQYGIVALVDNVVESAGFTGASTDDYKGHLTGPGYAIQGNILLGPEILEDMEEQFLNAEGDLACKLMAALQGANVVGADTRCADNGSSSLFAFLKVAQPEDVEGQPSFLVSVSTNDGAGIEPIDSLQTLFDMEKNCLDTSTELARLSDQIKAYPNPFSDQIQFSISDPAGLQYITIYNVHGGGLMFNESIIPSSIPTSDWPAGVYWVKIVTDDDILFRKLVKP